MSAEEQARFLGKDIRFDRIRRVTGYLNPDARQWNDGKQAEEAARVKHSVNSCTDDLVRAAKLQDQYLAQNVAYVGKMAEA